MNINDLFDKKRSVAESQLNEVDPRNFDSDEDYYAAVNAPAKPKNRGQQSPGVNPDDEDYFREIFRKKREAAAKAQGVDEAQTDYQKRRQRERDVDAGRPVKPLPKNPQTDYAKKRAKDRRDQELGEKKDRSPGKITKSEDPCWTGYHMVGKKKKNGREVPNCVPGKKG